LCSGYGTRLGDLGELMPKALLPIGGKPVIEYTTSELETEEEIERVIITSNSRYAQQFKYWVGLKSAAKYGKEIKLIIEANIKNGERLGAIGSIINAIKEAKIRNDMVLIFGDNFFTFPLGKLVNEFKRIRKPCIIAYDVHSQEAAKKFGVLKAEGGKVVEFEEKPESPKSTLISTGIYYIPKDTLSSFEQYVKETGKTDVMGIFIKWLIARTDLHAIVPESGEWDDIGALDAYKHLFEKYRE
jgi:glucose-1-phosphate thymidylyltransferase